MKRTYIAILTLTAFLLASCSLELHTGDGEEYRNSTVTLPDSSYSQAGAPASISGSLALSTSELTISWSPVSGASFYEVQRAAVKSTGEAVDSALWKTLPYLAETTSCTDMLDIEENQVYAYRVRGVALDADGVRTEYEWSSVVYCNLLTCPSSFSASRGELDFVTLSWSPVENAAGYIIRYTYDESDNYYDGWSLLECGEDGLIPNTAQAAQFYPGESNAGRQVRFVIYSVGRTGALSDPSAVVTGYSYREGAPEAPEDLSASQGESSSSITISWIDEQAGVEEAERKSYNWYVYRSQDGRTAIELYNTLSGSEAPLEDTANGRLYYIDTSELEAGSTYTYTVYGSGTVEAGTVSEEVYGSSAEASGYLLSPPVDFYDIGYNDSLDGFTFSFSPAVGAEEHDEWSYEIYGRASSTDSWTLIETVDAAATSYSTNYFSGPAAGFQYFTLRTSNGTVKSRYSSAVLGSEIYAEVPSYEDFEATDNYYDSSMSATDGFYPISIRMKADERLSSSLTLTVTDTETGSVIVDGRSVVPKSNGSELTVENAAISTEPGVAYLFTIEYKDVLGREGSPLSDTGYSALTDELYKEVWESVAFKPWERSTYVPSEYRSYWTKTEKGYIWYYISKGNSSSLSDQLNALTNGTVITQKDHSTRGGYASYNAVQDGLGGDIYLSYKDFGECEYMWTNGDYKMDVDASGNGTATLTSGMDISGWYPGRITFDNISVSSKQFTGTYTVTQSGRNSKEVDA